jgi:pSer/pThr/pTyr-binding forkhead associated (FHA) protein
VAYRGPDDAGTIHPLQLGSNAIGRGAHVAVKLDDEAVSDKHGVVYVQEDAARFVDVSLNGSIVDGRAVHGDAVPLQTGANLVIGTTVLVFTMLGQPVSSVWDLR